MLASYITSNRPANPNTLKTTANKVQDSIIGTYRPSGYRYSICRIRTLVRFSSQRLNILDPKTPKRIEAWWFSVVITTGSLAEAQGKE